MHKVNALLTFVLIVSKGYLLVRVIAIWSGLLFSGLDITWVWGCPVSRAASTIIVRWVVRLSGRRVVLVCTSFYDGQHAIKHSFEKHEVQVMEASPCIQIKRWLENRNI
jgi:hypothetical protein